MSMSALPYDAPDEIARIREVLEAILPSIKESTLLDAKMAERLAVRLAATKARVDRLIRKQIEIDEGLADLIDAMHGFINLNITEGWRGLGDAYAHWLDVRETGQMAWGMRELVPVGAGRVAGCRAALGKLAKLEDGENRKGGGVKVEDVGRMVFSEKKNVKDESQYLSLPSHSRIDISGTEISLEVKEKPVKEVNGREKVTVHDEVERVTEPSVQQTPPALPDAPRQLTADTTTQDLERNLAQDKFASATGPSIAPAPFTPDAPHQPTKDLTNQNSVNEVTKDKATNVTEPFAQQTPPTPPTPPTPSNDISHRSPSEVIPDSVDNDSEMELTQFTSAAAVATPAPNTSTQTQPLKRALPPAPSIPSPTRKKRRMRVEVLVPPSSWNRVRSAPMGVGASRPVSWGVGPVSGPRGDEGEEVYEGQWTRPKIGLERYVGYLRKFRRADDRVVFKERCLPCRNAKIKVCIGPADAPNCHFCRRTRKGCVLQAGVVLRRPGGRGKRAGAGGGREEQRSQEKVVGRADEESEEGLDYEDGSGSGSEEDGDDDLSEEY